MFVVKATSLERNEKSDWGNETAGAMNERLEVK